MGVEFLMVSHTLDFSGHGRHLAEELLEFVVELLLGRVEADTFFSGVIKLDNGSDVVLLGIVVHFFDDLVAGLLID